MKCAVLYCYSTALFAMAELKLKTDVHEVVSVLVYK